MDSLTVKFPVTVIIRVTEKYKQQAVLELQEKNRQLEQELQELDFRGRRFLADLEKNNPAQLEAGRRQVETEKTKREEARRQLLAKIKELAKLEPGAEIKQGSVESWQQIRVGDNWQHLLGATIVLEDGRVIAIRGGGADGE